MADIKFVTYYDCECAWVTKHCDLYHMRTVAIPVAVLQQYEREVAA